MQTYTYYISVFIKRHSWSLDSGPERPEVASKTKHLGRIVQAAFWLIPRNSNATYHIHALVYVWEKVFDDWLFFAEHVKAEVYLRHGQWTV